MKKILLWSGSVIGVAAVLALVFGTLEKRRTPQTITVNGECFASAPKDKTAITLRVTTLEPTAVKSMQTATLKASEITQQLKNMPVEMQTTQFNSYEKTEWNRDAQKSILLGIETTIAIEISADNITTIEQILTMFSGMPNVFSENLRMYTSPETMKPIVEECLGVAVKNARERANALAAGDDKKAEKMLSVAYGTNVSNQTRPSGLVLRASGTTTESAFDAAGTIVTTDTEVTVSVNAVFEIR